MLLYAVDGWRRPTDEITHSLMGCYKALHRVHVPADFIDVSELERAKANRYRVLYLPYCYALSRESVAAIRAFVEQGGTLWADGLVAWKDEEGATRRLPPGPLADVFGFTLEDIPGRVGPFPLVSGEDTAGELWRCLIPTNTPGATLDLRRPASCGYPPLRKGQAIYFATALTLAHLRRETPAMTNWIAAPAIAASGSLPVRLTQAPGHVAFRAMQSGERYAAVLTNWGPAADLAIRFPAPVQAAVEVISGDRVHRTHQRRSTRPDSHGRWRSAVILTGG